jgi:hypothetical protein
VVSPGRAGSEVARQDAADLVIRRNVKSPLDFLAGAIPTVDFCLHDTGADDLLEQAKNRESPGQRVPSSPEVNQLPE